MGSVVPRQVVGGGAHAAVVTTFAGCLVLGRRGHVGEQAALTVVLHFRRWPAADLALLHCADCGPAVRDFRLSETSGWVCQRGRDGSRSAVEACRERRAGG